MLMALVLIPAVWLAAGGPASAQTIWGGAAEGGDPVHGPRETVVTASQMTYDRDLEVVTGRGDVEVLHGQRMVVADTINYDIGHDLVTASGNVSLVEPDGNVLFADYVELKGDLAEGVAREIRLMLADRSRLFAESLTRQAGNRSTLTRARYTPCDTCRDNPDRAPLWQVKAREVVHDQAAREIYYRDATLEMFGVPVAYTPYLQHADPTVRRQSGLLPPTIGNSSSLGFNVKVPYFFVLSDHEDLTLTALATTEKGGSLIAEHRNRFRTGEVDHTASLTYDGDSTVGHIDGEGEFHIDETFRAGWEVALAPDDTYMRRYGFGADAWLTNRAYVEGFDNNDYASLDGFYFQGQRADDDPGLTPLVLPRLQYHLVGDPGRAGGYTWFKGGAVAINRGEGSDSRRLSGDLGWTLPYISPLGERYELTTRVKGDLYHVAQVADGTPADGSFDGVTGRVIPSMSLRWSLPLAAARETHTEIIEPIIQGIVAPVGGNPSGIPNDDSRDFVFDDTNLFSDNRFTGWDRVEDGSRLNYGLRYSAIGRGGGDFSMLIGQSYRFHESAMFGTDSGLSGKLSDVVGRLAVRPSDNLNLNYRFRLDRENFAPQFSNLDLNIGPDPLSLGLSHIYLTETRIDDTTIDEKHQMSGSLNSRFGQYWEGKVDATYDLRDNHKGWVSVGGALTYEDECFTMRGTVRQSYTSDRDYEDGLSFSLQLILKTLGEVNTNG
ncbi:LPS-assembly protein [Roseospirillum parvum]|uniref:LPS-assembly protein LptD n=2 Tax=Roseospirillum parvum TaxID=83401 RepID=A0A1G8ESD9_9PROT|nr:LPS-assembly protein [Roseospirillum parvum]